MELFLPSMLVFLLVTIVVFFILPKLSPMIIAFLAAALLAFGIYHHFTIFWSEYQQSTWQEQLKHFAPGIMIGFIIIYIIFSLIMFFTSGEVPVPRVPNIELPPANTATNVITSTINNALQAITPNNMKTNGNTNIGNNLNRGNTENNTNKNKNKNNNLTRSFLATI